MPNLIGQTLLNQYRVDSFVASGGMGAVYKVWDLKRNVALAMKVLHADFADDPTAFKYFQREARALQKLRHPNIVPFYGLLQTNQITFILEEYIDGPTLREVLHQNPQGMTISDALVYMKALCSALVFAHSNDVIHCDIKPGNVMLDSGGQVFLADFGIARHAESSTTTIAGAGTPAYMAPEQIRGEPVNAATDVYALGVMLFEMLAGQRPFRGDEPQTKGVTTAERTRYAHLHLAPPDPAGINSSISKDVAKVILKALSKQPAKRYSSALNFLEALHIAARVTYDQVPARVKLRGNYPLEVSIPPDDMPSVREPQSSSVPWFILGGGLVFIFFVILLTNPSVNVTPTDSTVSPAEQSTLTFTPAIFRSPVPPEIDVTEPPIATEAGLYIPTITDVPSPTEVKTSCPGAEPQHLSVGDQAIVCTKKDRLIIKTAPLPGEQSDEIFRVYPGALLKIVDGPSCADNSSWWQVEIPVNTKAAAGPTDMIDYFFTDQEYVGWVREGSDDKDQYYICRQ